MVIDTVRTLKDASIRINYAALCYPNRKILYSSGII
nr:MAG TPA: hypothetical protein [Caudoviricetes sp.]